MRVSKCKRCYDRKKGYCDMACSRKGKERIIPKKITMDSIKKTLENNIGCFIDVANISRYSREIKGVLNRE